MTVVVRQSAVPAIVTPKGRVLLRQNPSVVITVAKQGPPGEQGEQGVPGVSGSEGASAVITYRCAEIIFGQKAVAFDTNGELIMASSDDPDRVNVAGLADQAGSPGDDIGVHISNEIVYSGWAWTPGEPVYLGLSGVLTQTPPVSGYLVYLGLASGATKLRWGPEVAIQLEG